MKLRQLTGRLRSALRYASAYRRFRRGQSSGESGFPALRWKDRFVVLGEDTASTGFDRHYVYHTAWAARVLAKTDPTPHYDFGSLLYFSTLVSAFRPVRFFDYRPAEIDLGGLESQHADLTALSMASGSVASASCMHVLEHIGLGRYGDPVDPDGDRKAAAELERIIAPGGDLLIVTPVGKPRVCFNAHRVYSFELLRGLFPQCDLVEFSMAPDPGEGPSFLRNADPQAVADQRYACGCFWFRKRAQEAKAVA